MKKRICILSIACFSLAFSSNIYGASVSELNKQKSSINNSIKNSKNDLAEKKEEKTIALKEVEKLDFELDKVQTELENLQKRLEDTKKSLANSEEELKKATERREKQYESLKNRMRVMYEYGNEGYLSILLDAKGFTDFFKRIEYVNYIMEHDNDIFEKYQETEKLIATKVEQIKVEKSNIEVLKSDTEKKQNELNQKIKQKQELVAKLNKEQSAIEQKIKDLQKEDAEITRLINEAKAPKVTSSSTNKVYSGKGGRLANPVPAYAGSPYNDVYGYRTNPISGKRELHSGLDMKATYGTDIVAAEDGVVIYAGTRGGYGKTVIIDHGGGMTTLYAHNSKLVVSKGQSVKRGQVIAKAGSTGYSTGVHAHFEVRLNGKTTDPAPYLK